jgi:hypothetical protein
MVARLGAKSIRFLGNEDQNLADVRLGFRALTRTLVYGKGLAFDLASATGRKATPLYLSMLGPLRCPLFEVKKSFDRTGIFGFARRP